MAIPPKRWVAYALAIAGLSLLFDTYTFLRTNWSPLRVPMYVPTELALGYSLVVLGAVLLLAPALVRIIDINGYAPDASMKMGEGLAHESVEFRRRRRLPLKRKFSVLPNPGLVGGTMILLFLPLFVMVTVHDVARGIYVRSAPRHPAGPDDICLAGPIVITIKQQGSQSELLLNNIEVNREEFEPALKSKLAQRSNWEVFVEADANVSFADPMYAIDVLNGLHAKAVILTPTLKRQMAEKSCPLPPPHP